MSKSLPYWAQLLSFLFAALGFLGAAFIGLTEYLRTAELDTKLTKDCFYRLMDQGEAIFCRVTVIARNGPVLIRDVNVTLTKTDGAQKTFPLDVIQFGTLLPKPEKAFQEHNYYGRSTLHYLAADKPERLVYFCLHKDYKNWQLETMNGFKNDLEAMRQTAGEALAADAKLTAEQDRIIQTLVGRHIQTIMGSLQVETGRFRLSITLKYESTNARFRRWRQPKRSTASLDFTIPASFRNHIMTAAESALKVYAENELYSRQRLFTWPDFTPTDFIEG